MMRSLWSLKCRDLLKGMNRMSKGFAHALALGLVATPLVLVGCGSSDNNGGGTGGSASIRYDAGTGGTGGPKLDSATAPVDTGVVDATIAPDAAPVVDTTVVDVPLNPDLPTIIDSAKLDTAAIDVAPAIDTTPAIDLTPVGCTESPKFTGGTVTAHRTLSKACSPYDIIDKIQVNGNATLTIEAGVTVMFESGAEIDVGNQDDAGLLALGTTANPITFTSAGASPTAGDWTGIYFGSNVMGGTKIAYAKLDYCGSDSYACVHAASGVTPGRVILDHLTIDHVGTGSDGIHEEDSATNLTITNSTFSNIPAQQYAISVMAPSFVGIGAGNVFHGGALIEIQGGDVTTTTSWIDPGTPIAVTDRVNVGAATSPVLTIGPGMKFEFAANVEMDIGSPDVGQLVVAGTAAKHVTLTSLADKPTPGFWTGLSIDRDSGAKISYADFSYGGSDAAGGNLLLSSPTATASLEVDNSSFTDSLGYGIQLDCTTTNPLPTVKLTNNTYARNGVDTANANTEAANVGPGLSCP
jgi:hypothetical protein